ncbi:MAG: MotE family protein [Bdellovibrionales bacterium]
MANNPYDQFFKSKRKAKPSKPVDRNSIASQINNSDTQLVRRKSNKLKKKKIKNRKPFPMGAMFIGFALLFALSYGFNNQKKIEDFLSKVNISTSNPVFAQQAKAQAPTEKTSLDKLKEEESKKKIVTSWSAEEITLFSKLEERKTQLDQREAELKALEEELNAKRTQIDKKLGDLKKIRQGISDKLEDAVEADEEKINKLVSVYSSMKPQQAAKVFEKIDEDLAVRVLGKMKKKSAASILNLLETDKAQRLSEKYVGYISMK